MLPIPPIIWLLIFINGGQIQISQATMISARLAHSVCAQQSKFEQTKEIQAPLKIPPSSQNSQGWFQWDKKCRPWCVSHFTFVDGAHHTPRIYNGEETKPNEYPSMAMIQMKDKNGKWIVFCGAVLITPEYLLSAYHCNGQKPLPSERTRMAVEDHNIEIEERTEQYRTALWNKGYGADAVSEGHDVQLIKVSPPFDLNDKVQLANLPRKPIKEGKATAVGYGLTEAGRQSDVLRHVTLDVISDEECKKLAKPGTNIQPGELCAQGRSQGEGICFGDSGGPLYVTQDGVHTVVGITSRKTGPDCSVDHLSIFADVYDHLDWIENTKN